MYYLTKSILSHPKDIHRAINNWTSTKIMVFIALMAALTAVFQAAGGLLPGVGYFISPLATAPILLGMLISFPSGLSTYLLTICLLVLIEPTELFIFPFTTGLLGLGLGWSLRTFNRRLSIIPLNGLLLFTGICIPLYILGFPVFGPTFSSTFNVPILMIILGFSLLYSWLWLEFGLFLLRNIKGIMSLG